MLALTHRERIVLAAIGVIIIIGSILRFTSLKRAQASRSLDETPTEQIVFRPQTKDTLIVCVNVNRATREDLEKLPGIGSAIAGRIIEYREKNGMFSTYEDLERVNGIGKKKIEKIKPLITF